MNKIRKKQLIYINISIILILILSVLGNYHFSNTKLLARENSSQVSKNDGDRSQEVGAVNVSVNYLEEQEKLIAEENTASVNEEDMLTRENLGEVKEYEDSSQEEGIDVNTFEEFQVAVRDNLVTKINVLNDITAPTAGSVILTRNSSLIIEGNGNTIDMRANYINIPNASLPQGGELVFENIDFVGLSGPIALIQISVFAPNINQWNAKFHNVTTSATVTRLVWNTYGRVELSGNIDLDTRAENIIASDVKIHDDTTYFGLVNTLDVSTVYYEASPRVNDIAFESNAFDIGKNAFVQLGQTQTSGTTYPAVYLHYKQLTVGENATFNVNMPGNAVRLQTVGARMDVKSGALVNLTSKSNSGSVIAFSRSNTVINVEPEAEFYVIGNSSRALIDMASNDLGTAHVGYTGNQFILNQPKNFDIRNLRSGTNSIAVSVSLNNNAANRFSITNSDIDLWNVTSDPLGPSDSNFSEVEEFTVTGRGTLQNITTTTSGLESFNQNNVRRISGFSQIPSAVFDKEITDAHLNIKARVITGYVPNNEGGNESGEVEYVPVYASEGQATGTIVDTFGVAHENLVTDSEGYISYTSDEFNLAGKPIIAKDIKVGSRQSDVDIETVVLDVTPPNPAIITDEVFANSEFFSGTTDEKDVKVDYTINGTPATDINGEEITVMVDEDLHWTLPIIENSLSENDELQIFLTDSSGNRNPADTLAFHDAIFEPATLYVVRASASVLTVDFVNELNQLLPGYTIKIDGQVGDEIDLTKEEAVIKQLEELLNAGYEISERPANETAIILDSTAVTVRYKIQGVLSLASAPTAIDFGTLTYNATTKRVEDPAIDQPLIVTDTRAVTENGWTLTAALSMPMRNGEGQELVNALRYVYKGEETILDSNAQTVYLNTDGSVGSLDVSESWGNQTGTDGVKLQIGSSDKIHTGSYAGVITWKVMAGQP